MKKLLTFLTLFLMLGGVASAEYCTEKDEKFEITIVDGINFKASKYFDLPINSWNLNKLKPSISQARKMCKDLSNLDS